MIKSSRRRFLGLIGTGVVTGSGAFYEALALGEPPFSSNTSVSNIIYGFQADRDEGKNANLFVDDVNGSDTNDGLTVERAKLTIQAAVDAASAGDVIAVRNAHGTSVYRETIDLEAKGGKKGNPTVLKGYGKEKPVISGAEALTGAVACEVDDEKIVGANYASIYKVIGFETSKLATSNPLAAFLFENGKRMPLAMGRLPNPQYRLSQRVAKDWLESDRTIVDAAGKILGHSLRSFTDKFTKAQIENCGVYYHCFPNTDNFASVANFDEVSDTIYVTDQTRTYETNSNKDKFALVNLIPAMKKGEWAFVDNGSTVDFYFWPSDPENVDVNVEYSARARCINANRESHLEVKSLILERASAASSASPDGLYAISMNSGVGSFEVDVSLNNLLIRDTFRSKRAYGAIWARNVHDLRISNCTVVDAVNQFGIMSLGSLWNRNGMVSGLRVENCVVQRLDKSPISLYGQENFIISRNLFVECGVQVHANKANIYESGRNGLWIDNYWWACGGYWTNQEADSQHLIRNFITTGLIGDGRAIVDQSNATASPATAQGLNGDSYVLNNMVVPYKYSRRDTNSLDLGAKSETRIFWSAMNNIVHGDDGTNGNKLIANGWKTNVYTNGLPRDASDTLVKVDDVYENIDVGHIAVKPNSPTRVMSSTSIQTLPGTDGTIPLTSILQGYDVTKDITGAHFDPLSPPIGPAVDPETLYDFDPVWIERPRIKGEPRVGKLMSANDGYVMSFSYVQPTYQWYRVDDAYAHIDDWTEIEGATTSSYTAVADDVGNYLGRRTTMAGVHTFSLFSDSAITSP